jgi:hypothetical protein
MSMLGACCCRPIFGRKIYFGHKPNFGREGLFRSMHLSRQKISMQKKKEKKHEGGKEMWHA